MITIEDTKESFAGNGSVTAFAFDFKTNNATDLAVSRTDIAGVETQLTLDVDYSVSLHSNQNTSPGGTVTYPLSGAALVTGEKLTVLRAMPFTQPSAFTLGILPSTIESKIDNLTMLAQQLWERAKRSLSIASSDADAALSLGTVAQRAGKYPRFDDNGNVELVNVISGAPLSQSIFNSFLGTVSDPAKSTFFSTLSDAAETAFFTNVNDTAKNEFISSIGPASAPAISLHTLLKPRSAAEITAGVTPVNYVAEVGDLNRYSSVYHLENIGDVIVRDKTETAQTFAAKGFLDVNGDVTGRGTLTVAPGTYTTGFSAGDVAGYYYFRLVGDGHVAFGLRFNGNGQGTYAAYNPGIVNVNFHPVILGTSSKGQKVIAGHFTDAAGHAIEGATTENAVVALNTGARQNGVGITSLLTGFIELGNSFGNSSDSHFFVNSVRGAAHVANVGVLSNNGGGVDLAGCRETACVGNSYSDNLSQGIWVLRSPSPGGTGQTYRNVLTTGNVLRNNRNYADADKAEIATGSHNELAVAQGDNAAHIGNLIDVRTSVSSTNNVAFWNHPLANKTFHVANVTVGQSDTANSPTAVDEGAPRSHYAFNVGCPDDAAGYSVRSSLFYAAAPAGRAVYAYNVNWRIHPSTVGIPTEMESGDAFWEYHIVKALPQAGIRLLDVKYEGGFTHDMIEVTVASRNNSGLIKRTFIVRGQSGAVPTVLDNTLDKNFGAAIPALTIAATTGKVTISAAGNVGVANNQITGFFIRIISAEDYPERFVPIFAT